MKCVGQYFILSARNGSNRLCQCEKPKAPGHTSLESEAHRLPGFRVAAIVNDTSLWRYATDAEKETLQKQRPQTDEDDNPAKPEDEKPKNNRKKTSNARAGQQDFRQPSPPLVEEVTA